jgi:hypothetical protein
MKRITKIIPFALGLVDFPGPTATFARSISPQGDIVGFSDAGGVTHGFLAVR